MVNSPADPLCRCDNCDVQFPESELDPIQDLEQRLEPGGVVPAGQCPRCGALSYPAGRLRLHRSNNT